MCGVCVCVWCGVCGCGVCGCGVCVRVVAEDIIMGAYPPRRCPILTSLQNLT